MSNPENPHHEGFSSSELGELADQLCDQLDDKLGGFPEFEANKYFPVGWRLVDNDGRLGFDFKPTVLEFGEHWSSSFTNIPYHYEVSVKDRFYWEVPFPFLSGIPLPKTAPIRRRVIKRWDRTTPEHSDLTVVRLKTQFKRTVNSQLETGKIVRFMRGLIQICNQYGRHRNDLEALGKVIGFIQEI